MAAARRRSRSSGSSGSEEEEDRLARLREAAWDPALQNGGNIKKSKLSSVESCIRQGQQPTTKIINSKRTTGHLCPLNSEKVSGNELDTTPEFRAHVAKKLGAILDSSITILENSQAPIQTDTKVSGTEDDGFRLFSSSVPGDHGKPESLPTGRRRRQRCSSSETDSDQEWQRCQEAAVTAAEILQHSGLPVALQDSEPRLKKKKKKRKRAEEENGREPEMVETVLQKQTEKLSGLSESCKRTENSETEDTKRKKKKKKKKVEAATE